MWVKRSDWKHFEKIKETAKLQNTPQLICNMLNDNSTYCFIPRSSKSSDTCCLQVLLNRISIKIKE